MQERLIKPLEQKLDSLSELPDGFSFDSVQSWNKMEEKLTGRKRKNKKALWYMAAAASILVIVSITYFSQPTPINHVAIEPEKKEQEQPVVSNNKNKQTVLNAESKESKGATAAPFTAKAKKNTEIKSIDVTENVEPTKQPELVTQINTPHETKAETILPETTEVLAPLVSTPVKRKIIHINELGKESFLKEQQSLSIKEEKSSPEIITEEAITPSKPWYKKYKSSNRTNHN
jgi:hypothetical protein